MRSYTDTMLERMAADPAYGPDYRDAVLANLVPGLDRRAAPASAAEVLEWRGFPLATQEVATVLAVSFSEAREELGRIAEQDYVGADGFWQLGGAR